MKVKSRKKHKKHCKGEENDESSVKICDLPDPILQLIISSLHIKDAIRTSILSKRWEHLWKGVSQIELLDFQHEKRQHFMDFVRRLLVVCDCSSLKKFSLSCKVGEDASQVNEWLHGFCNPNIQELDLDFVGIDKPLVFPDHLFTCATLTNFRLSMPHIFELPSSIRFKSLRTLTLEDIIFPDSSSTQQLFSGCPSLEELALMNCLWVNVKAVRVSSPMLQKLEIRERTEEIENADIGGQDVSHCCGVVIFGTNLKSFSYDGDCINDYSLYGSTSVIDASVQVQVPERYENGWEMDAGYFVLKLLQVLSNVEKLSLSETSLHGIGSEVSFLDDLPMFRNLVELRVNSYGPVQLSTCLGLMAILHNSPCLEVVSFAEGVTLPKEIDGVLALLPMCFTTHLKRIEINFFTGDEEELHAIKFLLQAASVLDTLHVRCHSCTFDDYLTGSKRSKELREQIAMFPKGSIDCKIDLEYE